MYDMFYEGWLYDLMGVVFMLFLISIIAGIVLANWQGNKTNRSQVRVEQLMLEKDIAKLELEKLKLEKGIETL